MRQAPSFTSTCFRHFVRTCTARPTAVNPGQSYKPTDSRAGATSSGSRLIRPEARATDFNTSQATALTVAAAACNSNAPPTAGSPGRLPSLFLTSPQTEHLMWTPMVTFSSAAKDSARFIACARATRRSAIRHLHSTRLRRLTWVASYLVAAYTRQVWTECCSWRSITLADRLTITFTCWPAWRRQDEPQPTRCLCAAQ